MIQCSHKESYGSPNAHTYLDVQTKKSNILYNLCTYKVCLPISLHMYILGNEAPIIIIVARNSRLPTNEGYVSSILL